MTGILGKILTRRYCSSTFWRDRRKVPTMNNKRSSSPAPGSRRHFYCRFDTFARRGTGGSGEKTAAE